MHECECVSMCVYVNVSVFSGAELFMHRVVPLCVDDPVLHRLQLTEGLKVSLEGAACLGDTLRCQVILHLFVHFRSQFAVAERAAGRTAAGGRTRRAPSCPGGAASMAPGGPGSLDASPASPSPPSPKWLTRGPRASGKASRFSRSAVVGLASAKVLVRMSLTQLARWASRGARSIYA